MENGIFRTCANSVYQASPWWEGPGGKARGVHAMNNVVLTKLAYSTKYNIGVLENH